MWRRPDAPNGLAVTVGRSRKRWMPRSVAVGEQRPGSTVFTATRAASGAGAVPPSRVNTAPELPPGRTGALRAQLADLTPGKAPTSWAISRYKARACSGSYPWASGSTDSTRRSSVLKPKSIAPGVPAALHEKARADQQQHGNGHLDHDQPVRQAPSRNAPAGAAAAGTDGARELDPCRAQRRRKAGDQAGDGRDRRRETEDPPIRGQIARRNRAVELGRSAGHHEIGGPERDDPAPGSAHQRQQHALGDQLPHEASAGGAQTRAQGHLLPPRDAAAYPQEERRNGGRDDFPCSGGSLRSLRAVRRASG